MKLLKNEIRILLTAIMFYTRIPCPKNIEFKKENINKSTRYFPLIGWIVGSISFFSYWITALLTDNSIAVSISLIVGVLLTGAFHEDGLADAADGFGGGWTKDRILDIMKDSRIGAFGAIALILLFILKYNLLYKVSISFSDDALLFLIFINYHTLARLTAVNLIFTSSYSREDSTSKIKPIAKSFSIIEVFGAYCFGLLPLSFLIITNLKFGIVLIPLIILIYFSKRYFEKWIDGYTGDGLGAIEQIAECICLLSFISIWKFI